MRAGVVGVMAAVMSAALVAGCSASVNLGGQVGATGAPSSVSSSRTNAEISRSLASGAKVALSRTEAQLATQQAEEASGSTAGAGTSATAQAPTTSSTTAALPGLAPGWTWATDGYWTHFITVPPGWVGGVMPACTGNQIPSTIAPVVGDCWPTGMSVGYLWHDPAQPLDRMLVWESTGTARADSFAPPIGGLVVDVESSTLVLWSSTTQDPALAGGGALSSCDQAGDCAHWVGWDTWGLNSDAAATVELAAVSLVGRMASGGPR